MFFLRYVTDNNALFIRSISNSQQVNLKKKTLNGTMEPARTWYFFWKKTCNPTFWADYKFAGRSIAITPGIPWLRWRYLLEDQRPTNLRLELKTPIRCSPTKGGGDLVEMVAGGFGQKFWGQVVFNETSDLEGIFDVFFFKRKWAVDNFGLNLRIWVSNTVSYCWRLV